jgi:hypothetical protein
MELIHKKFDFKTSEVLPQRKYTQRQLKESKKLFIECLQKCYWWAG